MNLPELPNWLRFVLLVLSLLSFIPQLARTISLKNSSGLSVYFILLNLISATEQFVLAFFLIVNCRGFGPGFFFHHPVSTGDWLNLAQIVLSLLLWLALFTYIQSPFTNLKCDNRLIVCLHYPSDHRDASKTFVLSTYIPFLLIKVIPIFADVMSPARHESRQWFLALFGVFHTLFITWIITSLNIVAIGFQVRITLSRPGDRALSRTGLACQTMVFLFVALSWVVRTNFPYELYTGGLTFRDWVTWYENVGWAAVDSAIYALGQMLLLWIVSRRLIKTDRPSTGETEPLLNGR